ncbi:hypothetical protein LZ32DRAFT_48333 [Colletotrichum eremochloae]|nr:hypothetical protein LZ32DRAFT_48333 [Colletotrichum eremochloae]
MSFPPKCILLHLSVVRQTADHLRLLEFARATYCSPLCLRDACVSGGLSILATAQSDAQQIGPVCWLAQATSIRWLENFRETPDEGQKHGQDTKLASFSNFFLFFFFLYLSVTRVLRLDHIQLPQNRINRRSCALSSQYEASQGLREAASSRSTPALM